MLTEKNEKRILSRIKYWMDNALWNSATDELQTIRENSVVKNDNKHYFMVNDSNDFRNALKQSIYNALTYCDYIKSPLFEQKFNIVWDKYCDDITSKAISEYHKGVIHLGNWKDLMIK
jgi:hypothetical protein